MATIKQKKTFKKALENGGIVSKAAKGIYSPAMAKNPQKITRTKGWEELMEQNIPDRLLVEKHKELLNAEVKIRHFKKGELETEVETIDTFAISKGLDMGYKLKGKYAPEKSQSVNVNVEVKLDEKTAQIKKKYEEELRQSLDDTDIKVKI